MEKNSKVIVILGRKSITYFVRQGISRIGYQDLGQMQEIVLGTKLQYIGLIVEKVNTGLEFFFENTKPSKSESFFEQNYYMQANTNKMLNIPLVYEYFTSGFQYSL